MVAHKKNSSPMFDTFFGIFDSVCTLFIGFIGTAHLAAVPRRV